MDAHHQVHSAVRIICILTILNSLLKARIEAFTVTRPSTSIIRLLLRPYATLMDPTEAIEYADYKLSILESDHDYVHEEREHGKDVSYEDVRRAIIHFKELTGHTIVPLLFTVPNKSKEWPRDLWSMELGNIADQIRGGYFENYHQDLYTLGFEFFPSEGSLKNSHEIMKLALAKYVEKYSSTEIKTYFQVPDNDDSWPMETWGYKLGSIIDKVRKSDKFTAIQEELIELGINLAPAAAQSYEVIKLGLQRYKQLNSDIFVPFRFTIPDGCELWPKDTWGLKLGHVVRKIRQGSILKERRQELTDIGFIFESQVEGHCFKQIKLALINYKKLYGYMMVPRDFVVPAHTDDWPENMWSMELGLAASNIKEKGYHSERKKELIAIGFNYENKKKATPRHLIKTAILRYKELHGNLEIPNNFAVPNNSDVWPQETWGLIIGDIQSKKKVTSDHLAAYGF